MDPVTLSVAGAIIVVLLLLFLLAGLRVVNQYERGVIFVLGRLRGAKGPGVFWVPPFISTMRKIDLRIVTIELPPQEGVTRDNVTVKVSAVVYFYVVNSQRGRQQCAGLLPRDRADCPDDAAQRYGPVRTG